MCYKHSLCGKFIEFIAANVTILINNEHQMCRSWGGGNITDILEGSSGLGNKRLELIFTTVQSK